MAGAMILVLDTATMTPVVALAQPDGSIVGELRWHSRHRHGEELLQRIDGLLTESGVGRHAISAVVVGTGPGSFTGLRIGLATAKTIAYSLAVPLVGVGSTLALAAALRTRGELSVTLPAGASDRYLHRVSVSADGTPREIQPPALVTASVTEPGAIAVDLDGAPQLARERGLAALASLAGSLARLGAERLARGESDDVAALVPAYVALPRGLTRVIADMAWSPDRH